MTGRKSSRKRQPNSRYRDTDADHTQKRRRDDASDEEDPPVAHSSRHRSSSRTHSNEHHRSRTRERRSCTSDDNRAHHNIALPDEPPTRENGSVSRAALNDDTAGLRRDMGAMQATISRIEAALQSLHPPPSPATLQPPPSTVPNRLLNDEAVFPSTSTANVSAATANDRAPQEQEQGNAAQILQSFLPLPRPTVTAGISLSSHVPIQTKEKIWRDEYVPLAQLLPHQSHQFAESVTLSLCQDNNNLGLKLSRPKPNTLTLQQWEDAFLIYMAVYTERHHVSPAMCTYIRDVRDLARRGAQFQFYDEEFRKERATTHWPWDTVHQGLLFQATTPFRAPTKLPPKQYQPFQARIPNGYCMAFHNKSSYCRNTKCQYKHLCPNCEDRHPVYRCTDRVRHNKGQQPSPGDPHQTQHQPKAHNDQHQTLQQQKVKHTNPPK